MNALLAEQPLLVSLMLAALAIGLVYGWLQTGKKAAAVLALLAVALIPGAWMLAANWVTDREQIEQLIYDTADAVEANDLERVYQRIGDDSSLAQARSELPNYVFDVAEVNHIRSIDLIEGSFPPEADVDMNVKVTVSDKRGRFSKIKVPRRLILKLQKVDDDWMVIDYRHLPIVGGPDRFTTMPKP